METFLPNIYLHSHPTIIGCEEMTFGNERHDEPERVDDNTGYSISLGGPLVDIMKQLAHEETLVDVLTVNAPSIDADSRALEKETHGVRIILVGEDHVVLGPRRPVFSCFIPFDEILMIRLSDTSHGTEFQSHGEETVEGYEDDGYLIPDGALHVISPDDFDEAIADASVVVILLTWPQENPTELISRMERLAQEYTEDVLFVQVFPDKGIMDDLGVDQLPAVVILADDEIISQIAGVANLKTYRADIDEALESIEEDARDEC